MATNAPASTASQTEAMPSQNGHSTTQQVLAHSRRVPPPPSSAVIDLTQDSPPSSPRIAPQNARAERPAKRQRVATSTSQSNHRQQVSPVNGCLTQYVIPALDRKFNTLVAIEPAFPQTTNIKKVADKVGGSTYPSSVGTKVDEKPDQIIQLIASDAHFLEKCHKSRGRLSENYQVLLGLTVDQEVDRLRQDAAYRFPDPSSTATSNPTQVSKPAPNIKPTPPPLNPRPHRSIPGGNLKAAVQPPNAIPKPNQPLGATGRHNVEAGQQAHHSTKYPSPYLPVRPLPQPWPKAQVQPAPVNRGPTQGSQLPSTPLRDQARTSIESIHDSGSMAGTTPLRKSTGKGKQRANLATNPISPLSFRSYARATAWKYKKSAKPSRASTEDAAQHTQDGTRKDKGGWFSLEARPYLASEGRRTIRDGVVKLIRLPAEERKNVSSELYHVDFTLEEIEASRQAVREYQRRSPESDKTALREVRRFARKHPEHIFFLAKQFALTGGLLKRDVASLSNFFQDAAAKKINRQKVALRLELDEHDKQNAAVRASRIPSLLFAREVDGNSGFGRTRKLINFTNEFRKAREDELESRGDWNNCAGDISTITWVSDHSFLCGATAHSDLHNQQYNKPGNLLLYSPSDSKLQAYSDHRFPRPIVETGENATEAMRESQDPWLYASVVSSAYDAGRDRAYTSSFDKTVKIWKVDKLGARMDCIGTWVHEGHVNFVVASKQYGLVATAADVFDKAVRVYNVYDQDISRSAFIALSGTRAWNEDDKETQAAQKWGYYPATMQWGAAKEVQHLLLVGYSPRSISGDDNDIPDEKQNSGEVCLWNCRTGSRVKVLTGSSQNVFEVAWHPTQPCFIVASSPFGKHFEDRVKTQIRIFTPADAPEPYGAFNEVQCLDCPASDINELTIMPCSLSHCYITAAATNGNVYVWDTARGDNPVHVLRHGNPIGDDVGNDDTGVKFTAWGTSQDRFYTGGSDGVVKVWNVRNRMKPLVRDLLRVDAPISSGVFSPNRAKLAIGDASGRVSLLSVDEADDQPAKYIKIPAATQSLVPTKARFVRVPKAFTPHATPPSPDGTELQTGIERARAYVAQNQIQIHPNRCIGAIQGPAYAELGLYRDELHNDDDHDQPLLASIEAKQQENLTMFRGSSQVRKVRALEPASLALQKEHQRNRALDIDLRALPESTQLELAMEGVKLDDPLEAQDWDFEYEEE